MIKKGLITYSLVLIFSTAFCQEKLDANVIREKLKFEKIDSIRIKYYLQIGVYYTSINPIKSKAYLDSAFQIAKQKKLPHYLAITHANYGVYYYYTNNYSKALDNYHLALKYFESQKDTFKIIAMLTNIGLIHYSHKHYFEARTLFIDALALDKSDYNDENSQRRLIFNNLGEIFMDKKEFDSAQYYYSKSLDIAEHLNDDELIGITNTNLGDCYREFKKNDSALHFLNLGKEAFERIHDTLGLVSSYTSFGKYYISTSLTSEALKFLNEALNYSKQISAHKKTSEIYLLISEINETQNDYKSALSNFKKFNSINDSLFNESITRELERKEMQFEFDKIQNQKQIENLRKEIMYIIVFILLISLIIILSLFYALLKSKFKRTHLLQKNLEFEKTNLNQALEIKNKELTANIIYLIKKNELITDIIERLRSLESETKLRDSQNLQLIISDLKLGLDDKIWEEFEYRFNMVHNKFYENLKNNFPHLSPAEIKLCALLRLNFSSKDISAITFQSIKSIEVARSRLRKKLNISNTDINLVTFLMEY